MEICHIREEKALRQAGFVDPRSKDDIIMYLNEDLNKQGTTYKKNCHEQPPTFVGMSQ